MSKNLDLHKAKRAKKDEFYTQREDIERELHHYKGHFKGKVVYCNCDDPRMSEFFKFFSKQFEEYGLKKLIATCYKNQEPDLFSSHNCEQAIYLEYDGDQDGNARPDPDEIKVKHLFGDGDFRSEECINLLKQADIVVTNPPFSLFRKYVAHLMNHNKKFLIIGHQTAIQYKEIFPLIQDNRMWLGVNALRWFAIPGHYPLTSSNYKIEDGVQLIKANGIKWFTNLDHPKLHDELILDKRYSPQAYPHYDNYNAIHVAKTLDIPMDWGGVMGVPITFMDKFNPDQFEILGLAGKSGFGLSSHKVYDKYREVRQDGTATGSSGKKTNGNPVMRGMPVRNNYYVHPNTGDVVHSLYTRIFIRNKQL